MTDPKVIKVMIVDDHPVVRDGLKNMLDAFDDMELVGKAEDGSQALAACETYEPEVILMDMFMPGMDGIAATRIIFEKFPDIHIIILTSTTTRVHITTRFRLLQRDFKTTLCGES
jgi:two-component system, NarL family, response regulator LiaR